MFVPFPSPLCEYTHHVHHAAYLCARCPLVSHTPFQPIGRLEAFQYTYPFLGNRTHELCGDFPGMITCRTGELDDRFLIWTWKARALLINMARALLKALS